jgi:hypothetical protein
MWRFHKTPAKFWSSADNRVAFLRWLAEQIGHTDWHKISKADILANVSLLCTFLTIEGGSQLLKMYGNSPAKLIQSVLPEQAGCLPWKFKRGKVVKLETTVNVF